MEEKNKLLQQKTLYLKKQYQLNQELRIVEDNIKKINKELERIEDNKQGELF